MTDVGARFVLILGIGESGLAMARWCARTGARLRVADTRASPPMRAALAAAVPEAEIVCGEFDLQLLDGIDLVALSPGIDPADPVLSEARARGLAVLGEMALFADALDALQVRPATSIIAVTGTNGKSTTTALSAALLAGCGIDAVAAGNISPAALAVLCDRLDEGRPLPTCWVLEVSSFQLESAGAFRADAATVLNVSDDHLDRHGNLDAYAALKARIFAGDCVQVLNRDDPRVAAMALLGRRQVRFGAGVPDEGGFGLIERDGEEWIALGDSALVPLSALAIAGRHNALNAMAALALGALAGAPMPRMIEALKAFRGLPHRVEPIACRADGVVFYDDSKGTNVGSTVAALAGLGRPVVLIAGGDGKGQDFAPLAEAVAAHARAAVLIGRDAPAIASALSLHRFESVRAPDLATAVERANVLARRGDAVLLSPACASFDMFRNYVHRAEVFAAAVRALPGVEALR
ncbi:UDP-N-acetylmuramoyl-L-alanine--D-glutamate ligase [Pseudazoarcus pumilus]|uniref:UDP-N-acetylmuramoylalanine--D-glutamate ligase n=1 Tax=Pseudazoarcus pumilus TaxID=2067960 RepID=A0A2I6S8Q4_9RHOO|nr:UDP-N-acetylmuramoyl-L-alanine--D-glutamate ligase [Pseudazoarcus pumilus]AUN95636.1 UDP-N-acetylmuramoyl-L-alanine--D-glutamate ligase [Pseudazoarcus pumilus]